LEQEELIFTCLTILDRLGKAKLLKAAPLEVEKMWFNFSRKVCSAGNNARGLVYVKHLLQLLSAGRGNQENAQAGFDAYLPENEDGEARVYLSACALVCLCTALSATNPTDLLANDKLWSQTSAWLSLVADGAKKEQLQLEFGRVIAATLRGASKAPPSKIAQLSFVKNRVWCLTFVVCSNSKQALPALRDCFRTPASFGAEQDAVLIMAAKKMEDFRKSFASTLEGEELRREAALVLSLYCRALVDAIEGGRPRHDKLEPFAVEAAGTAATLLAEVGDLNAAEALLKVCSERLRGASLSPKYYNVGVALYGAGRVEDACRFVQLSCALLQQDLLSGQPTPNSFADRHLVLAQCCEKDGRPNDALNAALWAMRGVESSTAAASAIVRLWPLCDVSASKSLVENLSPAARWQLIDACSRWRPTVGTTSLSEMLLELESTHPRAAVERARLADAEGRPDEARSMLISAKQGSEGLAKFWLAVLEMEKGQNYNLLLEASQWLQDNCSSKDKGEIALIGEGLMDVFEWLERPSDAVPVAKCLASTFPDKLVHAMNEVRLERDAAVDWASLELNDLSQESQWIVGLAAADAMCALDPVPWTSLQPLVEQLETSVPPTVSLWRRCRLDYVSSFVQAVWAGDFDGALDKAVSAVRHAIAAAKLNVGGHSPWLQQRYATEANSLCAMLHENRGFVLEAEFLCNKGLEVCQIVASRSTLFRSLLCSTACRRRDLKEGKTVLSKLRGEAKTLQQVSDHRTALSFYKEAAGDFHMAKWEETRDKEAATEAYQRFKQAVALCNGRRAQWLKLKQGVALSRIDRTCDAVELWDQLLQESEDGQIVATAQFHLGLEAVSAANTTRALDLLEKALMSNRLDSLQQVRAASELAIISKTPVEQFGWLSKAIGVTHAASAHSARAPISIAPGWTVVSVSIVERDGREEGLLVSRVEDKGATVAVRPVAAANISSIRGRFSSIIAKSDETTRRQVASSQDKKLWWRDRAQLDQELKELLAEMEDTWFGKDRELFRPGSRKPVVAAAKKSRGRAKKGAAKDEEEDGKEEDAANHHLILVVGAGLEHIPWESMPTLRKRAVSRMPSLGFVMQSHPANAAVVDSSNTFYILNPSNDLHSTQTVFEDLFRQKGWRGIAGTAPTSDEFLEALKNFDLFLYCGHNSGEQVRTKQKEGLECCFLLKFSGKVFAPRIN
jgi:tetratricopeptide (TPR) repeat protein